jgi:ATP-dependent DNA helicase RecG
MLLLWLLKMATAPLPPRDKEGTFDANSIRAILSELCVQTADSLESDKIEIKGWCHSEKELAEKVSDASACLANASGGLVLVGISDEHGECQKFSPCPHPSLTPRWLVGRVQDLTSPPVECSADDVSDVLSQVLGVAGRNAFVIWVPKKKYFGEHLTMKGVSRIRVGKECRPHFTAEDDRSKAHVPDLTEEDLSLGSIDWGMAQHERHFKTPKQQWPEARDFLAQARLVERFLLDEERIPQLRVPLASLLLFGKQSALARHVPYFETVIVTDNISHRIRKNIVESVREICSPDGIVLPYLSPFVNAEVLKELVVNAYIHRCYRTGGPIMIRISRSGLEIESPGELCGGLQADDLIHCTPVYRNLLLSEGARFIGLCDKIGHGIDVVYRDVLAGGLPFPEFESEHGSFVARIPLEGSAEFREFLVKRSQALGQLDEVILLRFLWTREAATLLELSAAMQRSREMATRTAEGMIRKLMIENVVGDTNRFKLTPTVRHDIQTVFQSDQMSFLHSSLWGNS